MAKTNALSRIVSHALRHEPSAYGIVLDPDGWTDIDRLVEGIRRECPEMRSIDKSDVLQAVYASEKRRHEVIGNRIRAIYGHSVPISVDKCQGTPPEILFHGTTFANLSKIMTDGLSPMARQYVHLTEDEQTAQFVGRRKGEDVISIAVAAKIAQDDGITFYFVGNGVWLAKSIPPQYLKIT